MKHSKLVVVACTLSIGAHLVWTGSAIASSPPQGIHNGPRIVSTTIATASTRSATCGYKACDRVMLHLINRDRARYHVPPLRLAAIQSTGRSRCAGSYGHSRAMADSGVIWHSDAKFPRASFPSNICLNYRYAAENVGESASGNVLEDLRALEKLMMSEPHSPSVCQVTLDHACNLLGAEYRHVGIGLYVANGTTWLTEDFIG